MPRNCRGRNYLEEKIRRRWEEWGPEVRAAWIRKQPLYLSQASHRIWVLELLREGFEMRDLRRRGLDSPLKSPEQRQAEREGYERRKGKSRGKFAEGHRGSEGASDPGLSVLRDGPRERG